MAGADGSDCSKVRAFLGDFSGSLNAKCTNAPRQGMHVKGFVRVPKRWDGATSFLSLAEEGVLRVWLIAHCKAMDRALCSSAHAQAASCRPCSLSHFNSKLTGQQLISSRQHQRSSARREGQSTCRASMGIGFYPEETSTSSANDLSSQQELIIPKAAYGLSTNQMGALGFLDPENLQRHGAPDPVSLHLSCSVLA